MELDNSGIEKSSLKLVSVASVIATKEDLLLHAVFILETEELNKSIVNKLLSELDELPIDTVYFAYGKLPYAPTKYGQIIKSMVDKLKPELVMFSNTGGNKPTASMTSAVNDVALTVDCNKIEFLNDDLLKLGIMSEGREMKKIITNVNKPAVLLIDTDDFDIDISVLDKGKLRKTKVITKDYSPIIEKKKSIQEYQGIIALGNGVKDKDLIASVVEFCDINDYGFISTKPLVDQGKADSDTLVDYSVKLNPECLIAIGISGENDFLKTIEGTKRIVSVNIDENAPLNKVAHEVIIADAKEIIKVMIGL
ncbi:MAG: FAD-binding protein [Peptostreptococcaceae bacterium]|nr:FAD-binding protein [Peptostreptococcaceae bacterium]